MSAASAFAVRPLGARLARAMERRTFPRFRPLLDRAGIDPETVPLGLFDGRDAVGLLLGRIEAREAELLSVSVAESRRRRGGGLALLRAFETEAALRGARRAVCRYTTERGVVSPFDALLKAAEWGSPRLCSHVYVMDRAESLKAPWFTQAQERIGSMVVHSWRSAEPHALRLVGPANWVRSELHPRSHVGVGQDGAPQDLDASGLLRDAPGPDAPVTGWIIVHRVSDAESRVTALAVRPDRERGFGAGALLAHANRTLFEAGAARASFVVRPYQTRMAAFAERRIAPLIGTVRESWDCARALPIAVSMAAH